MSGSRVDAIRVKFTRGGFAFKCDHLPTISTVRGKLRCRIEALTDRVMRTREGVVVYLVDADFRALNNIEDNRLRIEQLYVKKRVIALYKPRFGLAAADIAKMIVDDLAAAGCL
jgi:hypothetical protein